MPTMLYDSVSLKPVLLVDTAIQPTDFGVEFWVYNGRWDGVYDLGLVFVKETKRTLDAHYLPYKFESSPSEPENYNSWFNLFDDLVSQGKI